MSAPPIRISLSGSSALLLDAAGARYDDAVQHRIWRMSRELAAEPGVVETAPGMNNLLVVFDPFLVAADRLTQTIRDRWEHIDPAPFPGDRHDIPVVYGGERGEDLQGWAQHCGMSVDEVVRRHSGATYTVAAVGAMPGFPYLSGLDPRLAWPRRAVPKARVEAGSVIVGGTQTSVMPVTAPSGWHIVGHADISLFDPAASAPSLMKPGDTVRFVVAGIEA